MIKAQIEDKELLEHLDSIEKDEMAVFVMADGRIRGALFHGTNFVNQMRAQHKTGIFLLRVNAFLFFPLAFPSASFEYNFF